MFSWVFNLFKILNLSDCLTRFNQLFYLKVCDIVNEIKTDYVKVTKCNLETEEQCHDTPDKKCHNVKKPVTKYR